jgi:uncharacterized membrane protein
VNVKFHDQMTFGQRAADWMARFVGSWKFLIGQSVVIFCIWIPLNTWALWLTFNHEPFDPYPFILLNLCLSLQAAYTGPILQITGNRAAERDRELAEHDHQLAVGQTKTLDLLKELLEKNTRLTEEIHA